MHRPRPARRRRARPRVRSRRDPARAPKCHARRRAGAGRRPIARDRLRQKVGADVEVSDASFAVGYGQAGGRSEVGRIHFDALKIVRHGGSNFASRRTSASRFRLSGCRRGPHLVRQADRSPEP